MDDHPAFFGACLTAILKKKETSAAQLARLMGYQSKTSIIRILRDEVSVQNIERFMQQLLAIDLLDVDEKARLKEALEVNKMGIRRYNAWNALWALLHDQPHPARPKSSAAVPQDDPAAIIPNLLNDCQSARHASLFVLNCCWPEMFKMLLPALEPQEGAPLASIEHYFVLTDNIEKTVLSLASIKPFLYHIQFKSHALRANESGMDHIGILSGNMLLCTLESSDGSKEERLILFQDEYHGKYVTLPNAQEISSFLRDVINAYVPLMHPITQMLPSVVTAEDYVHVSELIEALEWQRTMYMAEPDLCIHCIDPDTVINALVMDHVEHMIPASGDIAALISRFYKSQSNRYNNLYINKCTKHIILSRRELCKFEKTGLLQVHFFGLRAFTIPERIQILSNCMFHAQTNGHFNIYFWDDEEKVPPNGISCYEGYGLLFFDGHFNHSMTEKHPQAFLREKGIANLFCEYFRKELLTKHVLPYAEGMRFLAAMIDRLKGRL